MKAKKDGRYLNCFIDRKLLDEFEQIVDLMGKTKTRVLEDAMQRVVSPFYDENGELNIKDGYYLEGAQQQSIGLDVDITKIPCKVLSNCTMMGNPYVTIWKDGQIIKTPVEYVEYK